MKCPKCHTEFNSAFCPNCGTAANVQKNTKSGRSVWIAFAIVIALGLIGFVGSELSSSKKIDLEQINVVKGVSEYKINRVFTTDIIEGLLRQEGASCYNADNGEKFVVVDTEVKNLKTKESAADELIKIEVVCGEKTASCEISLSMYESKKSRLTLYDRYTDNSTKSIKVENVWFTDDVKPTDYEKYDYYDHYIADEGKTILAVKMSVDNEKNEPLYINEIAGVACHYEQGSSSGGGFYLEGEDGNRRTIEAYNYLLRDKPSIEPYGTGTVYYLIQLPETVENGPLELELYLAGETYYYTVH